jgi:uncharacterized membrane protein
VAKREACQCVRPTGDAGGRPGAAAQAGTPGFEPYSFVDYDRHGSLLWLAIAFAVLAVLLAHWRGLLALVGGIVKTCGSACHATC